MNRILVVAALVMVLAGCGDTSPFGNQRYQIVKGTHQDYLLDTKTGRTWRYFDDAGNFFSTSDYWAAIPVKEEEEAFKEIEEAFEWRRTPPKGVTPGFPWSYYYKGKKETRERKIRDLDSLNEMLDAE